MTNETMTVFEALNEIKMLEKRIIARIDEDYVVTHPNYTTKINGKSISETANNITSNFNSVIDLLKRRNAVKNAIVCSNAGVSCTNGTIELFKNLKTGNRFNIFPSDKKFTIAEIIDMKNNLLPILEKFSVALTLQVKKRNNAMVYNTTKLIDDATKNASAMVAGVKDSIDSETVNKLEKTYIENNTIVAIDPINIEKTLKELNEFIEVFRNKSDSAVSIHNATTIVEISY